MNKISKREELARFLVQRSHVLQGALQAASGSHECVELLVGDGDFLGRLFEQRTLQRPHVLENGLTGSETQPPVCLGHSTLLACEASACT